MNHDLTPLRTYLNSLVPLNDQEWKNLNELLYVQVYDKKELFLAEGKVCKTVGFILEAAELLVQQQVNGKIVLKVV